MNNVQDETRYVQAKDVAWNHLGETIIAFTLSGTREFHNLNETAAVIFEALALPRSIPELATELSHRFDVEIEEASTDVQDLLSQLRAKNLVMEAV
jgi:hypothetical protein